MSKETPFVYCLRPKRIINPFTKEPLVVPCGHCSACATIKASRYAEQCTLEGLTSAKVYFVTLTFANSFIPQHTESSHWLRLIHNRHDRIAKLHGQPIRNMRADDRM
jgi:hypothetical protein